MTKFTPHALVVALSPDPNAVPKLTVLRGYLGAASKPDLVRIYTSLSLAAYVEVSESAVKRVEGGAAAIDPSTVWLDSAATAVAGPEVSLSISPDSFLVGNITERFLQANPGPMIAPHTAPIVCTSACPPPHTVGCPHTSACPPQTPACPPPHTSACPPPVSALCPTHPGHCPTNAFSCPTGHVCPR
jgi:hypothetical protein